MSVTRWLADAAPVLVALAVGLWVGLLCAPAVPRPEAPRGDERAHTAEVGSAVPVAQLADRRWSL